MSSPNTRAPSRRSPKGNRQNHEDAPPSSPGGARGAGAAAGHHLASGHGGALPAHGQTLHGLLAAELSGRPPGRPTAPRSAFAGLARTSLDAARQTFPGPAVPSDPRPSFEDSAQTLRPARRPSISPPPGPAAE